MHRLLGLVFAIVLLLTNSTGSNAQGRKVIYLTFDDGPTTVYDSSTQGPTLELLDILDRYGVKVTFFLPGESVNSWEGPILARMLRSGHAIGIHSFHHGASIASNGMSYSELASEYLLADARVRNLLLEYPDALTIYQSQARLYRRPGGSARLNDFLQPENVGRLNVNANERSILLSTYDYSGWHVTSGDSIYAVLRQINIGQPLVAVDEQSQEYVTQALWNFLTEGESLNGSWLSMTNLAYYAGSLDEEEGIVVLGHDTFTSMVRSWDVIIPRLLVEGYEFGVLPREVDAPNSWIIGIEPAAHF